MFYRYSCISQGLFDLWAGGKPSRALIWGGLLGLSLAYGPLGAESAKAAEQATKIAAEVATEIIVISNDRGGLLGERSDQIRALAERRTRIELRGTCLSACTMYLALPDACVDPDALFGFHGPSWYGKPLAPAQFEYWSNVMADHYRPGLRRWYLATARHKINSYFEIPGAELIRMGYQRC